MGSQRSEQVWKEAIMRFSLLPLATIVSPLLGQLKFNGGVSSSSSNNGNSPSSNRNTNRPSSGSSSGVTDVDEKFFLGGDTPSLTGNQALDGGIVGLGLGALGAAVLGPTIQGALNGAQQSQGYSCGRRKRQANFGGSQTSGGGGGGGVQETDVDERFFLPTGQGCTCNTNGRKRRQAPGEDEPGTRFFGGLFGGTPHCGNCCYNTQPFNNNGFNSNFQNQGFNNQGSNFQNQGFNNPSFNNQGSNFQNQSFNNQNQGFNNQNQGFNNPGSNSQNRCQCDYSKTFSDQNGLIHGACQRSDNTGRKWCYTTGWSNNCGDLQTSKRFPSNPWSYRACGSQG